MFFLAVAHFQLGRPILRAWLRWSPALLAFYVGLAGCNVSQSPTDTKSTTVTAGGAIAVGEPAPEITGSDVNGEPFKLSDYRGKVVMLDFWGNW
jgi:hypothetical protein